MVHHDLLMKYRTQFLFAHKRPKCISKYLLCCQFCGSDLRDANFSVSYYLYMFYFVLSQFQLLYCVQKNSFQSQHHRVACVLWPSNIPKISCFVELSSSPFLLDSEYISNNSFHNQENTFPREQKLYVIFANAIYSFI